MANHKINNNNNNNNNNGLKDIISCCYSINEEKGIIKIDLWALMNINKEVGEMFFKEIYKIPNIQIIKKIK